MFDITLRPLKDGLFDPACRIVPAFLTPLHITILGFVAGLASCFCAASNRPLYSVILWALNRILDCLDGALARWRGQQSDLGGFLDLLFDFTIYSAIPICCALGQSHNTVSEDAIAQRLLWLAVSLAEASFHLNNFVLFYVAAVLEKRKALVATQCSKPSGKDKDDAKGVKELTSVMMKPALVEGFESGALFTLMLAAPAWTEFLSFTLVAGVSIGIVQRVCWVSRAL